MAERESRSMSVREAVRFLAGFTSTETLKIGGQVVSLNKLDWAFRFFGKEGMDEQNWNYRPDTDDSIEAKEYRRLVRKQQELKDSENPDDQFIAYFLEQSHEGYAWMAIRDALLYELTMLILEGHHFIDVIGEEQK